VTSLGNELRNALVAGATHDDQPSGDGPRYGIAIDLGTTTVSAALVYLPQAGEPLMYSCVDERNAQAQDYGRDILSRLAAAMAGSGNALRDRAQDQIIQLIERVAEKNGLTFSLVACATDHIVIAGNSAMAALLVGADVSSLATAPFAPVRQLRCVAGPLAELFGPERITVLEPLDAFVGGDVRAGLIAADMAKPVESPRLLIDLGTNAEIVLAMGHQLFVCSAPAGPAFEGGGFRYVGSDILADVAELLRSGVLGQDGKLDENSPIVKRGRNKVAYVTGGRSGKEISQRFIRDLQLAKAATSTALTQVLVAANCQPADVSRIDIAGAFGSALDPTDLTCLGLIPEVWQDRICARGNAALKGALAVLGGASPELDPGLELTPVTLPDTPDFNTALIAATDFSWR